MEIITKYMRKVILVFAISIIMMPSFASAAWWNPVSWFRKADARDAKIEVVKTKINLETAATSSEPYQTPSSKNETKATETEDGVRPTVKSDTNNAVIIQAEIQKQIQGLKQQLETLNIKLEAENRARIDGIKRQQAKDIANEEARDAQLRLDAQTQEAQEEAGKEDELVAKIDSKITSYIQDLNIRISGLKNTGSSASNSTGGCIKTSNGCQVVPNNSFNVGSSVNGNIRAQLAQRRDELTDIQNRLKEKGTDGITENDRKFLTSLGISW